MVGWLCCCRVVEAGVGVTVADVVVGVVVGDGDGVGSGCSGGVAWGCFVVLWCMDESPGLLSDREEWEHVFREMFFQFGRLRGVHWAIVMVSTCMVRAGPTQHAVGFSGGGASSGGMLLHAGHTALVVEALVPDVSIQLALVASNRF